jgi:hypothetical protein
MNTAEEIRRNIATLIPKAESGADWAEICKLESLAVNLEENGEHVCVIHGACGGVNYCPEC